MTKKNIKKLQQEMDEFFDVDDETTTSIKNHIEAIMGIGNINENSLKLFAMSCYKMGVSDGVEIIENLESNLGSVKKAIKKLK